MNRSLVGAVLVGTSVGLAAYRLLVDSWFVVAGIAAVYAGATYFYLAFDVSPLGRITRFDDRAHRLGYAIGLFGVTTSAMAVAQHYGAGADSGLPLVVVLVGVVAFLDLASKAQERAAGDR